MRLPTFALLTLCLCLQAFALSQEAKFKSTRVRLIILSSRQLGPEGPAYNEESLAQLSRKLKPTDIPAIVALLDDPEMSYGAEVALASQCDAAFLPMREAIMSDKTTALDADDMLHMIAGFDRCTPATRQKALAMVPELDAAYKARVAQSLEEIKRQKADDERIQNNSFKILDPAQRKAMTRAEREEVFHRSIKAAGLENPKTPGEKDLVLRMYRTMVLDEPPPPSKNPQ